MVGPVVARLWWVLGIFVLLSISSSRSKMFLWWGITTITQLYIRCEIMLVAGPGVCMVFELVEFLVLIPFELRGSVFLFFF